MSLAATLASRLALLLGGRLALLFLSLVTLSLLARLLGPDGFGVYRTAVAYLGLVVVLADLGLASIFVREISRPDAEERRLIANALALRLVLATTVLAAATGLAFLLPFAREVQIAIVGGAGGFLAYSIHLLLFGLFQQRLRQQGVILAEFTGGLLLLTIIVGLGRLGAEPFWFVLALAVSYVVTLAGTLLAAARLAPLGLALEPDLWRRLLTAALPVAVTGSIAVLYFRADTLFLAALRPLGDVGLYGVPIKILDALMGFALLVVGLFAPLLGKTAKLDPGGFARHLEDGLALLTIGSVGVAVALFILAEEIVVVMAGEAFRAAGTTLTMLGVVFVSHSSAILVREAATCLGVQGRLIKGYLAGFAVAFLAYITLIPPLGGPGAALALFAADVVILAVALRVVRGSAGHPIRLDRPMRALAAGLAAVALTVPLHQVGFGWPLELMAADISYLILLVLTRALHVRTAIAIGRDLLSSRRTP